MYRRHFEKAFRREGLPAWDRKWRGLSYEARASFLERIDDGRTTPADPKSSADRELLAGGFLLERLPRNNALDQPGGASIDDFVARMALIRRLSLLDPRRCRDSFDEYLRTAFLLTRLPWNLERAVARSAEERGSDLEATLRRAVVRPIWPIMASVPVYGMGRVERSLVELLWKADGPTTAPTLRSQCRSASPSGFDRAFDDLIGAFVFFEDLDPTTLEIVVDFFPPIRSVFREGRAAAARDTLRTVEELREFGPLEGIEVGDLRALLMEVASDPPSLKVDGSLFQKAADRVLLPFAKLPESIARVWLSPAERLKVALEWVKEMGLAEAVPEGSTQRLTLNDQGRAWLNLGPAGQVHAMMEQRRSKPFSPGVSLVKDRWEAFTGFNGGFSIDRELHAAPWADKAGRFFGVGVAVALLDESGRCARDQDESVYRDLLDRTRRAFEVLKPGAFHRVSDVVRSIVQPGRNPLNLGLPSNRVALFVEGLRIESGECDYEREERSALIVEAFLLSRLIPLGCLRIATDSEGALCVTRDPLLDSYFSGEPPRDAVTMSSATKVIIQPDFSIIVIGMGSAEAADLLPFCDRLSSGGHGAVTLKMSRESLLRGIGNGLSAKEILGRLERHAKTGVPANVRDEVTEWASRACKVNAETIQVLRCPSPTAADAVVETLKKNASRLNETLVQVLDPTKLNAAERQKLKARGVLVDGSFAPLRPVRQKSNW